MKPIIPVNLSCASEMDYRIVYFQNCYPAYLLHLIRSLKKKRRGAARLEKYLRRATNGAIA